MSAIIALRNFERAAQEAFQTNPQQQLIAHREGSEVIKASLPSSVTPEVRELYKKTWAVFRKSLIEVVGRQKVEWVCHRYRFSIDQMERDGRPLLPEHVELFSIGLSQHLSQDILQIGEKISQLSRQEIQSRLKKVHVFDILGKYTEPVRLSGTSPSYRAWFFHDRALMDKEKQILLSDIGTISFPAFLERLSKTLVNRELQPGQLIPVAGRDGSLDYYRVYRKIIRGGLVADALKPAARDSTLKPLLVFRPTQFALSNMNAYQSYLDDLQPCVGKMGYESAKPYLAQLMHHSNFRRNGEKIDACGYSLGGTHNQLFVADFYEDVSTAIFHNNPCVDHETAERFAQRISTMGARTEPLNIQIYRTTGDVFHFGGDKHLGWNVDHPFVNIQLNIIDHASKKISSLGLHAYRIFDNHIHNYQIRSIEDKQELFDHLDNSKRGAEAIWYETTRRVWSMTVYSLLSSIHSVLSVMRNVFGIRILREVNHYQNQEIPD